MQDSMNERLNKLIEENEKLKTQLANISFAAGELAGCGTNLALLAQEIAETSDSYSNKLQPTINQFIRAKHQLIVIAHELP